MSPTRRRHVSLSPPPMSSSDRPLWLRWLQVASPALAIKLNLGLRQPSRWPSPEAADPIQWIRCIWSEATAAAVANRDSEAELAGIGNEEGAWSPEADHLVVLVNGLSGSPEDWRFAAEQLMERLPDKVIVHRSESNTSKLTHDGVDVMGERLAEEVRSIVMRRKNLRKISFVAHSLGGLISRYAIGLLYEPPDSSTGDEDHEEKVPKGRIAGLEPMNFVASATPHLGSRWRRQLPFLFGIPFLEQMAVQTSHLLVGRTGKHLYLTDSDDGKPPLLVRMVDDCEDGKFMSALCSFKRRVAYANSNYDHIVGWRTSSIRRQHELPKVEHRLKAHDEKYPHVVHIEKESSQKYPTEESTNGALAEDLEEKMIRGLTQVTWERVDICFHKSWLLYNAHNNIQVRNHTQNSDGKDVICHMLDNFVV